MVSERTKNEVWRKLLDAARLARYYEALADRHRRNRTLTRLFLLAAAASGVAALLDVLPDPVRLVAGGLIAFVVAWDFVADYAKKAAVLHAISLECSALEEEWRVLWFDANDDGADDSEVLRRNQELSRKIMAIAGWAKHVDVREDRKLNEECEEAAYGITAERHAA